MKSILQWYQDQQAQSLAEYGLILAGIAIIATAALASFGSSLRNLLKDTVLNKFAALLN